MAVNKAAHWGWAKQVALALAIFAVMAVPFVTIALIGK